MRIRLLISFFASLMLYVVLLLTSSLSLYAAAWTQSLCTMAFTFLLLKKYAPQPEQCTAVAAAILAGRLAVEIPMSIATYPQSWYGLFIPLSSILAILLAALCHRERRLSVLVLSLVLLTLVNTLMHQSYLNLYSR